MKKNICSNFTQREMFGTSVMPASERGSVRKTPSCYLFKGTTAQLPHFSSQQPWGFSQKSWKCARETPPQKTVAYAAVSASLREAEHGSLTDRWLPHAPPVAGNSAYKQVGALLLFNTLPRFSLLLTLPYPWNIEARPTSDVLRLPYYCSSAPG